MVTTFLSIVLDLVSRVEVERFVGDCDRDAIGRLFVRGLIRVEYSEFFGMPTVDFEEEVGRLALGLV